MEKEGDIKKWFKEAVERGYSDLEIRDLLKSSGYSREEIHNIFSLRKKFKSSDKIILQKNGARLNRFSKKPEQVPEEIREVYEDLLKTRMEVAKAVVGQKDAVDAFMCALLCDGHVLLEGVPGIAKTLLVKTLAQASGCSSNRIQFTVDLLPSDIVGITTYTPDKGFETIKGPVFSNFIVADEINRSPPKTQSALIEAMQEKQVTIGKQTYPLPKPFFVMANNNPLESSGVYDLPEAQVDRFLFKVLMAYPKKDEEVKIMEDNMTLRKFESFDIQPALSPEKILHMQEVTKQVFMDDKVKDYIVRLVEKTRKRDFDNGKFIEWGGSPRASIGLFIAAKAWALMNGRNYVIPQDVKDIAHFVLRHRIILNYKARAEGITSDKIIDEIFAIVNI